MPKYTPILVSCEMNDYGYWVAVFSVAPWLRTSVTVAKVGIARSEAQDLARESLPLLTPDI